MDFKKYINNEDELKIIPISDRYSYYLNRNLLKAKTGFVNQAEHLVSRKEIERSGLTCKPFWEDAEASENDSEAKAFNEYIKGHPDFDVMIRAGLMLRLIMVQKSLPEHLRLVLKAGLRPVEVQEKVFKEELKLAKIKYPARDNEQIYKQTMEYVTNPKVNIPPHSTGGAIDIHLWDTGHNGYVDFGSPINAANDSSWGENHNDLTDHQIANRRLLRDKMLAQGFANLAAEWWHFSYGDQRWAVYYDKRHALYGVATPDLLNRKNEDAR